MNASKNVKRVLSAMGVALAATMLAPSSVAANPPGATAARPPQVNATDASCRPKYPAEALKARTQGDSHLRFLVDATGKVKSAQIVRGADYTPEQQTLDIAAINALARCVFTPGADADGKPAEGYADVAYHWSPDEALSDGDAGMESMANCRPEYPPAARRKNVEGTTMLEFHLDEAGKVLGVDVVQHSGDTREHHMLDAEAARALALCPFKPAHDDAGKAVPSAITLPYTWRID